MTDLRKEARHKPCLIRLEGCDGGGKTTVLCHYRLSGYSGVGMKPPDVMAAFGCRNCHDIVDGRKKTQHDRMAVRLAHAEGCLRTLAYLEKHGIIKV